MTPLKGRKAPSVKDLEPKGKGKKSAHSQTDHQEKSVQQVSSDSKPVLGKNTATYWQDRIFKPVTRGVESPHYCMKVAYKGRRMNFTLGGGNQKAAAASAAGIYLDLLSLGVEGTLAKHRPQKAAKGDKVATIGEWITAAQEVSAANDATFTAYARALRTIAGGIAELKKNKKRFGPKKGGSTKYRETIDALSLETLSPEALQRWRLAYVKKAKTPVKEKSAKNSCNSLIRQAGSLFSGKITYYLKDKLTLPTPRPFEIPPELKGPKQKQHPLYFQRQNTKYFSKIDAPAIVLAANTELSAQNPEAFLAFLLAIGAGLRRAEIDTLCWHQIDTKRGLIRMENTKVASLKTDDSRAEVAIDDKLASTLQGYRALKKAKDGDFVIKGDGAKGKKGWGQHYRANTVFNALIKWLRDYEQDKKHPLKEIRKPIHELRKELGALITSKHGIYAASHTLRHSTVATTVAYYADKKERTTVDIGSWLSPENVIPLPEPAPATEQVTPKKATR